MTTQEQRPSAIQIISGGIEVDNLDGTKMIVGDTEIVRVPVTQELHSDWWPGWVCPQTKQCDPNALVLEGSLFWEYDDIRIGDVDLGVAFGQKWPDEKGTAVNTYRFIIERLEETPDA